VPGRNKPRACAQPGILQYLVRVVHIGNYPMCYVRDYASSWPAMQPAGEFTASFEFGASGSDVQTALMGAVFGPRAMRVVVCHSSI
jgi:hypothetical protein